MFNRILVPLDGSDEATTILPQLARLGTADADIVLMHVLGPLSPPAGMPPGDPLKEAGRAQGYLATIRSRMDQANVTLQVRRGAAADEILKGAAEADADLIALTTHGRTGLSRMMMGSVAESVLRGSEVPTLISRPSLAVPRRDVRRILVAEDGTPVSRKALQRATSIAREAGAEVTLVRVVPIVVPMEPVTGFSAIPSSRETPDPSPELEITVRRLREDGVDASYEVAQGDVVKSILDLASQRSADLIVMGTEGREGLSRFLQGSVAEEVLRAWTGSPILFEKEEPVSD